MCEKNEQTLPVTIRIIDDANKHRERLEFPTIDFSPSCTLSSSYPLRTTAKCDSINVYFID